VAGAGPWRGTCSESAQAPGPAMAWSRSAVVCRHWSVAAELA
jgi:hypothetical protein